MWLREVVVFAEGLLKEVVKLSSFFSCLRVTTLELLQVPSLLFF